MKLSFRAERPISHPCKVFKIRLDGVWTTWSGGRCLWKQLWEKKCVKLNIKRLEWGFRFEGVLVQVPHGRGFGLTGLWRSLLIQTGFSWMYFMLVFNMTLVRAKGDSAMVLWQGRLGHLVLPASLSILVTPWTALKCEQSLRKVNFPGHKWQSSRIPIGVSTKPRSMDIMSCLLWKNFQLYDSLTKKRLLLTSYLAN